MKLNRLISIFGALALGACAPLGQAGDACTTSDDCEEGLECHIEEHGDEEEEHEEEVNAQVFDTCMASGSVCTAASYLLFLVEGARCVC